MIAQHSNSSGVAFAAPDPRLRPEEVGKHTPFEPSPSNLPRVRAWHTSIPPSTHNGVGGSKGYGRAHVACATPAAVASSASASATTVTTVATTVRSLERRCVRAWRTFHTPPQHTIVLGAQQGVCGCATHAVFIAPAAVASSASTAAHAHAASICSATKPPDFSLHMQCEIGGLSCVRINH